MDIEKGIDKLEKVKQEHHDNVIYCDVIDYILDRIGEYTDPYSCSLDVRNETIDGDILGMVYVPDVKKYFANNFDDIFEIFEEYQNNHEMPEDMNWSAWNMVQYAVIMCIDMFDYVLED